MFVHVCSCMCMCVCMCVEGAAWGRNRASQWRGDCVESATRLCALFLVLLLLRLLLPLAGVVRVAVVLQQLRSCLPLAHSRRRRRPSSASPLAPPHVAADSPVVAAPLGRVIGAYVPQQRLCLGLGLGVVVRRVGGRRHLEDVDRAVGCGEGAACGVQVYRLQHARRQPVPRAGAGVGMMFYTDHNIRGEATRRVCPVTPSRRFPVTTATPGTAAMGGAGALTLPRTVRLSAESDEATKICCSGRRSAS